MCHERAEPARGVRALVAVGTAHYLRRELNFSIFIIPLAGQVKHQRQDGHEGPVAVALRVRPSASKGRLVGTSNACNLVELLGSGFNQSEIRKLISGKRCGWHGTKRQPLVLAVVPAQRGRIANVKRRNNRVHYLATKITFPAN